MSISSRTQPTLHPLRTPDGLTLPLKHYSPVRRAGKSVLLLHGASASSETFVVPRWGEGGRGLVDFLLAQGYDVWTLDWRGGCVIAGDPAYMHLAHKLNLDGAAEHDVPCAIAHIRAVDQGAPLSVVGHCMGAAALAMAIGAGYVTPNDVRDVVMTAIGLFYDVGWDGWVKADDQALERSLIDAPQTTFIDCNAQTHAWPKSLESAYDVWPAPLLPARALEHPFSRLTFMFGRPFLEGLVSEQDQTEESLRERFGAMPLALYIQAGQCVRRGFAAPYDDTGWGVRSGPRSTTGRLDSAGAGKYLNVQRFRGMRVTLMTGALNQLWHPDSVRRMHEWLQRDKQVRVARSVLPGFGHQDLYWAKSAPEVVYPRILSALA